MEGGMEGDNEKSNIKKKTKSKARLAKIKSALILHNWLSVN